MVVGSFRRGWRTGTVKLELLTVVELSGQQSAEYGQRKLPSRRRNTIQPLELKAGGPIVHEVHGVERFVELVQRTIQGVVRDRLVIEYVASKHSQPGNRLLVPMDQLDQLTRYVGSETLVLDEIGGADWAKRKSRVRRAVKKISAELIKLYATGQTTKGHAFGPDAPWQRELEDTFNFVGIPDRLAAIQEVKADMEKVIPMDHPICGDIGFGRTEITVRAALRITQNGEQAAVLVPITLLVSQHHQTFASRFAGFPAHVAQLSRFQSEAESKKALEGLANGRADLVIGTHRLLAKEVALKGLGLVIIDEEQRFGVEHRERLKELRVNADVPSMSVTPIPCTLEIAITGVWEMSIITTPPKERHPVLTLIDPYGEGQVRVAIRHELAREGQTLFVRNRVENINKVAVELRGLVLEVRVVIAHGQTGESKLEQVVLDSWERRADVLVCITIAEAGLNIQIANTFIVDRAGMLGFSQLHQLRGRVGCSSERGYAYFLCPADKALTQTIYEHLTTVASHIGLDAGMSIAICDLELRGVGNLPGGEQSGHTVDVGSDMYLRSVGEAVAQYRDEDTTPEPALRIGLPVDAYLPDEYAPFEWLRLETYRQVVEVWSTGDAEAVRSELTDRYGELPLPVEQLLAVVMLRNHTRGLGVVDIAVQGKNVRIEPVNSPEPHKMRLQHLYPGSVYKQTTAQLLVSKPDGDTVAWVMSLLDRVIG